MWSISQRRTTAALLDQRAWASHPARARPSAEPTAGGGSTWSRTARARPRPWTTVPLSAWARPEVTPVETEDLTRRGGYREAATVPDSAVQRPAGRRPHTRDGSGER